MKRKSLAQGVVALGLIFTLLTPVFAHPILEGGIRVKFRNIQGFWGSVIEFVADARAGEARLYIWQPLADEKSRNLAVQTRTIRTSKGKKEVTLLAMPDPETGAARWFKPSFDKIGKTMPDPRGKKWYPVSPAMLKGGVAFYWIEVKGMLALNGGKAEEVTFIPGKDARGQHCLKVPMKLAGAKTIRIDGITITAFDPKGRQQAVVDTCFTTGRTHAWKTKWQMDQRPEIPLSKFAEGLKNRSKWDAFRTPELGAIARR